jgi:Flp pilus assembly pilin Flp
MIEQFSRFWTDEGGQDIIEYSLLITFIAIACMWFVGAGQPAVHGIWTTANSHVSAAGSAANGVGP